MDVITSLILLSVLVAPPMLMASREIVALLSSEEFSTLTSRKGDMKDKHVGATPQDKSMVYDGMITVEIPVLEPQVVAYEPLLPQGEEAQIEIIIAPGQASNA